jgi:hypothetical protein
MAQLISHSPGRLDLNTLAALGSSKLNARGSSDVPDVLNIVINTDCQQLDSGTTLIYLLTNISDAVNALFSPPGVWNPEIVAYSVNCNAIALLSQ